VAEQFADAVIVAAGSSRRMEGVDKLAAPLAGRPVLAWAIDSMRKARSVRRIVVVTAAERLDELARQPWLREAGAVLAPGGAERQGSVASGVAQTDASIVLVHDGARPFVRADVVDAVADAARRHGAAIPILPVADSLKHLDVAGRALATDRDGLYRAQTPQGAHRDLLIAAHEAAEASGRQYGDEAALLEAHGIPIATVRGDAANLKVTEPDDLLLIGAIASARVGSPRYASATDSHPFGPEDGLMLGGLLIPEAPRLFGHSDGDVVLHAVSDALFAAAGLADLGRQAPASDPSTRGIASNELLRMAIERSGSAGWRTVSADVSILGSRPRLGGARLDEIRRLLAGLLAIPVEQVSIKASTGNLGGPEGAGRAITATALVGVMPR